jgi:tetratricopeptide (TPR) repeat protein
MKFKINYDINKLILMATTRVVKLQIQEAYDLLILPIEQGVVHSDIFYLYGEVCRVLKKLNESEKFLLDCLKFEYHSPFVFYSLGLLYYEKGEYKYSISFFKHFMQLMVRDCVYS